jgi:hypothetical protein
MRFDHLVLPCRMAIFAFIRKIGIREPQLKINGISGLSLAPAPSLPQGFQTDGMITLTNLGSKPTHPAEPEVNLFFCGSATPTTRNEQICLLC